MTARETSTAVATRALNALADRDTPALAAAIRGDETLDAALEHVDAIREPIVNIDIVDVSEWETNEGFDQARATFHFTVGRDPR